MSQLNLRLTDEEKFELATTAVQQFLDNEAPWREVVQGITNVIADAATKKAVLMIRDMCYPILVHEKQHVLVAILDRLLEDVTVRTG